MARLRWATMLLGALVLPAAAQAADYRIIDRIKVADGGFDYATFDPQTGHVYMPRGRFTTVIDTRTGQASQLNSAPGDHIALPVPSTGLLAVTHSAGGILLVDAARDTVVAKLESAKNPNSAVYDPVSRQVVVMNKESGLASLVDPRRRRVTGTIPITTPENTLEFPVTDGKGLVFDNLEKSAEIAVIDLSRRKVLRTYRLQGCEDPKGLAYVAKSGLLVSACANSVVKVLRARDGAEVASLAIGKGQDAVIYDPVRDLAFVPCGQDGALYVISLADPKKISVVQRLETAQGSRTGTVDPSTGRLYLMSSKPDLSAPVPANGRIPRLPGSWEVLVIAPG